MKQTPIAFTDAEINHIRTVLVDNHTEGSYYGPVDQWWARHRRILTKLDGKEPSAPEKGTARE